MTRHIERQLEERIDKFGEKEVLEALNPLVTQCKWRLLWVAAKNAEPDVTSASTEKGNRHNAKR